MRTRYELAVVEATDRFDEALTPTASMLAAAHSEDRRTDSLLARATGVFYKLALFAGAVDKMVRVGENHPRPRGTAMASRDSGGGSAVRRGGTGIARALAEGDWAASAGVIAPHPAAQCGRGLLPLALGRESRRRSCPSHFRFTRRLVHVPNRRDFSSASPSRFRKTAPLRHSTSANRAGRPVRRPARAGNGRRQRSPPGSRRRWPPSIANTRTTTDPAMIQLRPYQQEAVRAVYEHLRARDDNPCVVIPTAGGKTPVLATICKDAVTKWKRPSARARTRQGTLGAGRRQASCGLPGGACRRLLRWPQAPRDRPCGDHRRDPVGLQAGMRTGCLRPGDR